MEELTRGEGGRVGKGLRSAFVTFLISSDINVTALVEKYYKELTADLRGSAPAVWNAFLELNLLCHLQSDAASCYQHDQSHHELSTIASVGCDQDHHDHPK